MSARQTPKIFVVEDEIITAKAIEKSLKSAGYEVVGIATSGSEAIEQVSRLKPDLVLMDIKLKGLLDGVLTTQRIQAHFDIPVIYLTALSDDETLKRVTHSRPYGYLVKPFREQELHEAVDKALQRHQEKRRLMGRD
jgi:AmiR/NasT family two-component response regulator